MGGHAFDKPWYPPMAFPRMSESQYSAVKAHASRRLLNLFHHVGVGIEAPEKLDHGDVDFVVCRARTPQVVGASLEGGMESIRKSLGARFARMNANGILYLAMAIPEVGSGEDGLAPEGDAVDEVQGDGGEVEDQDYVQIDIKMCPAPSLFAYTLFTVSYGDLSGYLKTGSHPFGLSFRPSGLWLRVPELAETDVVDGGSGNGNGQGKSGTAADNKSLLFLSSDVDAILSFLGLDPGKWREGFASLDEVFQFAVSAKWFSRADFYGGQKTLGVPSSSPSMHSTTTSASGKTATSASNTARIINNNSYEDYKAKKRPVWNMFVSEFLPLRELPHDPFASADGSGQPSPAFSQRSGLSAKKRRRDSALGSPETIDISFRVAASAASSVTLALSDGEEDDSDKAADARAAVLAAALTHFPGAEARYHVLRATRAAENREKLFWERVKAELPDIIVQRQWQEEQERWQQAEAAGEMDKAEIEVQMKKWVTSGKGRVAKDRVAHTITALRRYTRFESETGEKNGVADYDSVGTRVPRLRPNPELDDAKFVPWTSTASTTTTSMSDDDLLGFIADSFYIAYELDRSRSRPHRGKKREEAAKRKAERREERELEREHERAREEEEEEEERQERCSEGLCVGQ